MIFNSISFLFFFVSFFFLYWLVFKRNVKHQNLFILFSSYVFYCFADWRFLAYLIGTSALSYVLGIYIEKENKYRRLLVWIAVLQGVGGLAYFKYFNFFISSINDLFDLLHINFHQQTLQIILPLGISYFTFRVISYILDVDKGKTEATKDIVLFFSYVAFFPTILSGPIDKGRDMLPQLEKKRELNYNQIIDGLRQFIWGLFKKVVIADNCVASVDQIFGNVETVAGSSLIVGAFFYTVQLYADFSGYSDMAIGVGKMMGFRITKNFNFPFFAQNIADFWRRWHISLTSWLTEYVFTPLSISFRDFGKMGLSLAIVFNFIVVGLWHGANWTFVIFGFIHGLLFIPLIIKGTMNKKKTMAKNRMLPNYKELGNMIITFTIVMLTMVFIRAENSVHAFAFIRNIFSLSVFSIQAADFSGCFAIIAVMLLIPFFIIEWIGREQDYAIEGIQNIKSKTIRWICYSFIVFLIGAYIQTEGTAFIYFQF